MKKHLLAAFLLLFCFQYGYSQPENTNISNGVIFDGEPYLAINPTNNQNFIAAWMKEKYINNGFHITITTRASFDGGNTWSTANSLPHFGANFGSADVSMAFDKNGVLYISYIDYQQSPDSGGIFVARSFDGGLTWDTPSQAFSIFDVPGKDAVDRPWLVVDHSNTANTGTLYITSKPAYWIPPPNRNYFKESIDSGHTWSAIANVDGGNYLVGNLIQQPMAAPATTVNGNFCAIYPSYVASQNPLPAYYLATSGNRGQSFNYTTVYSAAPAANDTNLKNGYHVITHPTDSNKMVFLLTDAYYGDADIFAFNSTNGGQTWGNPVRVNDDSIGNGKDQDMVWGAYNEQGNLVVTWRDRRNSPDTGFWNAGYDFYYATSTDNGQTFSANQKISTQYIAFDSVLTAKGNDFMSCAYINDTLYALWGDTRNGKMNIYFAKTTADSNVTTGFVILDGEEPAWKIFPNPVNGEIHVSVTQELVGKDVSVYNARGEKITASIISTLLTTLDIKELPSGIYFLKIGNETRQFDKE